MKRYKEQTKDGLRTLISNLVGRGPLVDSQILALKTDEISDPVLKKAIGQYRKFV